MRKMLNLIGLGGRARLTALFACAAACVLSASGARAGVVANWAFPASGTATSPDAATTSSGTTGTPSLAYSFAAGASGTPTLSYAVNTAVDVLQFATSSSSTMDGVTLQLTLTASAAISLATLTYSTSYSGTTALVEHWAYQINGGASTTLTSSGNLTGGTLTSESISLSAINLTSGQSLSLNETTTGGNGAGTTRDLDFGNITVNSAVPEPITYAMAVFGLVFVGGSAGRFYLARRRSIRVG